MSPPRPTTSPQDTGDSKSVANTIRQSIAHFFDKEPHETVESPVTNHILRDIGVDRTIYRNI